ncbi:MAG: DUF4440 domain-containing protein [Chthoniobacterales bacterium]|nr:DUF4440 domain-containing protein [Chthoniobacterales bacterium]
MKKNWSANFNLSAVMAFGIASSAAAQDAAAPFRRSPAPQQEAATPAPTAKPTPEIRETASPESDAGGPPEQKQAEAPEAAPAPAPRVIQEQRARAVEPRPASPPPNTPESRVNERAVVAPGSKPTFDLSDQRSGYIRATIRALEKRWQEAIVKHDVAVINELVADDFVGVSSSGRTGSKSTLLNEVKRDGNSYTSAEARSMVVRTPGAGIAVVTGIAKESGTTTSGQSFTNSRRFTDTWVERAGRWQCVASQTTQLPNK